VLGGVLRRLSTDMRSVYGHRVVMVETFTDLARHRGSCYAAANFRPLAETSVSGVATGRGSLTVTRSVTGSIPFEKTLSGCCRRASITHCCALPPTRSLA